MNKSLYLILLLFIAFMVQCSTVKDKTFVSNNSEKSFTTSYTTDIKPLIERSCMPCHAPENKHDLKLLDTYSAVSKEAKEILKLVQLPQEEKMFMPYKLKKQPLSEEEISLVKKWVEEGKPE